jgi:hypothetical protein
MLGRKKRGWKIWNYLFEGGMDVMGGSRILGFQLWLERHIFLDYEVTKDRSSRVTSNSSTSNVALYSFVQFSVERTV